MISLEQALKLFEERQRSLIRFIKQSEPNPSQQLKDWIEAVGIALTLIKKEIEKNG